MPLCSDRPTHTTAISAALQRHIAVMPCGWSRSGTRSCWSILVGASWGGSDQANTNHSDGGAPTHAQNIREHQDGSENASGEASNCFRPVRHVPHLPTVLPTTANMRTGRVAGEEV